MIHHIEVSTKFKYFENYKMRKIARADYKKKLRFFKKNTFKLRQYNFKSNDS